MGIVCHGIEIPTQGQTSVPLGQTSVLGWRPWLEGCRCSDVWCLLALRETEEDVGRGREMGLLVPVQVCFMGVIVCLKAEIYFDMAVVADFLRGDEVCCGGDRRAD